MEPEMPREQVARLERLLPQLMCKLFTPEREDRTIGA